LLETSIGENGKPAAGKTKSATIKSKITFDPTIIIPILYLVVRKLLAVESNAV
jgi:hypothetical protein